MPSPSVRMSDEMRDEIEERCAHYQQLGTYVREALRMRFELEDTGEWADRAQSLREEEVEA